AELAEIAEPDIGVITNVGPVHVELLGSVEAVAAAKAELIGGLRSGGTLIVPAEAGLLEPHLPGRQSVVRFGPGGDVDAVTREVATPDGAGTDSLLAASSTVVTVATNHGEQEFSFPFTESLNLTNALAAIAAGLAAGSTPSEMAVRSGRVAFSKLRGEHIVLGADSGTGRRGL